MNFWCRRTGQTVGTERASCYLGIVAALRQRGGRFLIGAISIVALTIGACAPVMTTRYREVPISRLQEPSGAPYRFQLAGGSNVDMRVARISDGMVSGQKLSAGSGLVDLRDVQRVGVGFDEKDQAATNIKYLMLTAVGYAGFLLAGVMVSSLSQSR